MPETANLITTLVAGLLLALVLGALANRLRLPPLAEREIARGILERLGLSGPDDTATVRSGKAAVTEAAADGDASTTKAEEA